MLVSFKFHTLKRIERHLCLSANFYPSFSDVRLEESYLHQNLKTPMLVCIGKPSNDIIIFQHFQRKNVEQKLWRECNKTNSLTLAEIISQTFELVLKQILRNFKIHCKNCFKKVCGQKIRRNMRHQRFQHRSNTLWLIECLKWNLILCKNIYMLQKVVYKYSENFRLLQIDYFYT